MKRPIVILIIALAVTMIIANAHAVNLGGLADKAKDSIKTNPKSDKKDPENPKSDLPNYTGPKKRLGIMDMEVKVSSTTTMQPTSSGGMVQTNTIYIPPPVDFGTGLSEMLTTALINSNRFILLERKALSDIQNEQMLATGGTVDPSTSPQPGKLLGAQALIRGAVTEYSYRSSSTGGNANVLKGIGIGMSKAEALVVLDVRIYDVATGQIIDSVKAEGKAKSSATAIDVDKEDFKVSTDSFKQSPLGEATRQAIDKAVKFICQRMEKVPWEGRIAEIDANEDGSIDVLYLNAGSSTGLKEGDKLIILKPGRAITDPETKTVIGRTKDTIFGTCEITSLTKGLSLAKLVEGDKCEIGDIVRFYDPKKPVNTVKPKPEEDQSAPAPESTQETEPEPEPTSE